MYAESIGRHFSADADLVPPDHPRIPPELLVMPFDEDGLLFVGTREPQLIRGKAARDLLPRLVPQLNGRSTVEELASRFPQLTPGTIRNAVTLLYSRGLLEDGCPPPAAADLQDVDSFLGRFVDVTRVNRNRRQALDRLQASSVLVGGSDEAADLMQRQLSGSGIGRLGLEKDSAPSLPGCSLLVAVATRESDDLASLLERARHREPISLRRRHAGMFAVRSEGTGAGSQDARVAVLVAPCIGVHAAARAAQSSRASESLQRVEYYVDTCAQRTVLRCASGRAADRAAARRAPALVAGGTPTSWDRCRGACHSPVVCRRLPER